MERQQYHSWAILLHGQANGQEERQGEKEELSRWRLGGLSGSESRRCGDTELETQSRAVSRRQYESKKSLVSVGGVDGVWVGQT